MNRVMTFPHCKLPVLGRLIATVLLLANVSIGGVVTVPMVANGDLKKSWLDLLAIVGIVCGVCGLRKRSTTSFERIGAGRIFVSKLWQHVAIAAVCALLGALFVAINPKY